MKWALLLAIVGLLLAGSAGGQPAAGDTAAEDARAAARAPFLQGTRLAADNRWEEARAAFERALAIYPHARTWFNVGYCERSLGRSTRAWRAFQLALERDRAHGELSESERARGRSFVEEIEVALARVEVVLPAAGAEVAVDGEAISGAPGDERLWLAGVPPGAGRRLPRRFQLLLPPGEHHLGRAPRGHRLGFAVGLGVVAAGALVAGRARGDRERRVERGPERLPRAHQVPR